MVCKIKYIAQTKKGEQLITLELKSTTDYESMIGKDVDVEIDLHREKRSLDANGYMWTLCDKIANAVQSTKEAVYRNAIKEVGVFRDIRINKEALPTFERLWTQDDKKRKKVGWLIDVIDEDETSADIRCYYGSSCYNSKQISRLISYIQSDAKELGIETATPDEVNRLISVWEGNK